MPYTQVKTPTQIKNKQTGQISTINVGSFDPNVYDVVNPTPTPVSTPTSPLSSTDLTTPTTQTMDTNGSPPLKTNAGDIQALVSGIQAGLTKLNEDFKAYQTQGINLAPTQSPETKSALDKLKEELKKITKKEVQINISEIKRPELDAVLVSNTIATTIDIVNIKLSPEIL